jgi:O-antigen ligase
MSLVAVGARVILDRSDFLRSRFFEGDTSIRLGGLALNAEGRSEIWGLVYSDARQSLLLGHGAGTADSLVREHSLLLDQPHNDYLRILHDFGLVGLLLWVLAILCLFYATWMRAWRHDVQRGYFHWAAFLALLALSACMVTDNPIAYIWIMVPVGALVGLSLATPLPGSPKQARIDQPSLLRLPAR